MIKAVGFLGGQTGDLVIQTVTARAFKQQFPDSELTFAMASKYRDIMPLFFNNPNMDDFHVWDGYDAGWPSDLDREYVYFKGFHKVFNAMSGHTRPDWYNSNHYAVENCLRFGLTPPTDLSYELVRWFQLYKGYGKVVTLTLFPSKGTQLDKTMPIEECEKLCISLKKLGYKPVQLGGKFEVKLENAFNPDLSIFEATKLMLSSSLHITADTAFSSIAAGYKHKTLGFYGLNYPDMKDCFSHLPVNVNAHYIKNKKPQTIQAEELIQTIKTEGLL